VAKKRRGWVVDIVVGGIIGAICSAIVAVNFVIWVGPDQGYQSSIGDVFEHNLATGIVTVAILAAGPVLGVFVARRQRRV